MRNLANDSCRTGRVRILRGLAVLYGCVDSTPLWADPVGSLAEAPPIAWRCGTLHVRHPANRPTPAQRYGWRLSRFAYDACDGRSRLRPQLPRSLD